MKLLQNKGFAWVLASLMILAAVPGLGGMKLGSARQKAVDAFFTGQNGFSPYDDLINRREAACNLLHVADKTALRDSPSYTAADRAWKQLDAAKTPEACYEANQSLQTAVDDLYAGLLSCKELDDTARGMAERQYSDFTGRMSNLRFDDNYNEQALRYNRICKAFPARLIAALTRNGPLPVFREEKTVS